MIGRSKGQRAATPVHEQEGAASLEARDGKNCRFTAQRHVADSGCIHHPTRDEAMWGVVTLRLNRLYIVHPPAGLGLRGREHDREFLSIHSIATGGF